MITKTVLQNLIHCEEYTRRVLPYIQENYFEKPSEKIIFQLIKKYLEKYNKRPTQEILDIDLESRQDVNELLYKNIKEEIAGLSESPQNVPWLIDVTEEWCKERALHNGLLESLDIIKDGKKERGQIVKIMEDAIAVSFDTHVGHDFIEDADERFTFYHTKEHKIEFDIEVLNKITDGGLLRKSLSVIMGGVGVGKSFVMCHMAAANLTKGLNVLYITMEMSEYRIAERIDANLLDEDLSELRMMSEEKYKTKIGLLKEKIVGKLVIKEYPTAGASAMNFRHLLHELKLKRKFIPDIIYIDYLNICASARVRMTSNIGLYSYVKSIAEEIRGLAVECNVPVVTATQFNRDGYASSDPGMEHTAESFGLPATADLILAIIYDKDSAHQLLWKQIKNRFGDPGRNERFYTGRNIERMRLYDLDQPAKEEEEKVVVNVTANRFNRKVFEDFK